MVKPLPLVNEKEDSACSNGTPHPDPSASLPSAVAFASFGYASFGYASFGYVRTGRTGFDKQRRGKTGRGLIESTSPPPVP